MQKNKILTIGSIHFDVISQPLPHSKGIDKMGTSQIEIGGTGYNIAVNLLKLGTQSIFLSSIPSTSLGKTLFHAIEQEHLSFVNIEDAESKIGVFNAHLDSEGELVSAISQMPIESVNFTEQLLEKHISEQDLIISECNCSPESLQIIGLICQKKNKPFWISAVSEIKSLRAACVKNLLSGIVLNEREANFFIEHKLGLASSLMQIEDIIQTMQNYLNCDILLTRGPKGAIFKKVNNPNFYSSESIKESNSKNRLGAGDAFFSAFLMANLINAPALTCLEKAHKFAHIISKKTTANAGISDGLEKAINHFQNIGITDKLTGLNNRSGMQNIIEKRHLNDSEIWILLLDIDNFKKINDDFGHVTGDLVLKKVADIFQKSLRKSDISGRWGGEEFIGFLTTKNKKTALSIAQRIRIAIETSEILPQRKVTASLGIAQKKENQKLEDVFEYADQALYKSKKNGKNQVTSYE